MQQHNRRDDDHLDSGISNFGGYQCENCKRRFQRESLTCPHCEFPIAGTPEEKDIFYQQLATAKQQLSELEDKVSQAKLSLMVISGINFLFAFIYYFSHSDMNDAYLVLIINLFGAILFLLLGIAAKDNPYTALTCGLIVYVGLILYRFIDGQPDLLLGAVGRDIFIIWIFKGISNVGTVEELKKQIRKRQP